MRPRVSRRPVDCSKFYGIVHSTFTFADGTTHHGVISPSDEDVADPSSFDPEIWLDFLPGVRVSDPLLQEYNQIVCADTPRIGFGLAGADCFPDKEAHRFISLAYRVLDTDADRMWPISIRPHAPIRGWPASWNFSGWYRFGSGTTLQ